MAETNWQEKYMQFQMLQQQIEKVSEHAQFLQQQQAELEISQNAIEELGKTQLHNEVLVPVADGIFFKAELKDNKKLIVHVGSDTTVENSVTDVLKLLGKQHAEIKSRVKEVEVFMQQMQEQMSTIYAEIAEVDESETKKE